MARIRAIKPEFWSSPGIETIHMDSRLLFIAMWNWADDNGVGVANPRELLGFAFPLDEEISVAELRRMLVEIRRVFGVKFYSVVGRNYYWIPSWEKHQKFDRRSKGKHPGPDDPEAVHDDDITPAHGMDRETPPNTRGNPTSTRSDSVAGTGEQGNRGTGEVVKDLSDSHESNEQGKTKRIHYSSDFEDWWKRFPKRTGSKKNAFTQFKSALNRIPLEELNAATDRLAAFVQAGHKEAQFVKDGERWLKEDRWEEELIIPQAPQPQSKNTLAGWGAPSAQFANDQAVFDSPKELTWPN